MGRMYQTQANNLTVSTVNDILQLRNSTTMKAYIHEIRVWQTSDTVLNMNAIRIRKGTGGATGTATTVNKFDPSDGNSSVTGFSLPGTNVGTFTFDLHAGWNILQEFIWIPTPKMQLFIGLSTHLSISLLIADALTMGVNVVWEEM